MRPGEQRAKIAGSPALLTAPLLAGALLTAACSGGDAAPSHDGAADLTLVDGNGAKEQLRIAGPPGEVFIDLHDLSGRCDFDVNAVEPPSSDLTAAADARRVQIVITAKQPEIADLLAGKAQTIAAHAGSVFASDSTVDLERHRSATEMDRWFSTGGTVTVDALPAKGGAVTVRLVGVQLAPISGNDKRTLDGTITGDFDGVKVLSGAGGHCPAR
jgi:hypothetical protein